LKQEVDIGKMLAERGVEHVKIGVFDTDGIMRGKYLSREKCLAGL
jgi:glutamine synthetase